jgi:hypothetical protein
MKSSNNGSYFVHFFINHNQVLRIPPGVPQRLASKNLRPLRTSSITTSPCLLGASLLLQHLDIIFLLVLSPER